MIKGSTSGLDFVQLALIGSIIFLAIGAGLAIYFMLSGPIQGHVMRDSLLRPLLAQYCFFLNVVLELKSRYRPISLAT